MAWLPFRPHDQLSCGRPTLASDSERFAEIENLKPRSLDISDAACFLERPHRVVDAFTRQLERSEMHRDAARSVELQMCLHGFSRIHVHGLHEPARLVRADGQQGQVDWSQPSGNLLEKPGIGRVPGEIDASLPHADGKTTPERAVAIEGSPRSKMMSGRRRH